MKLTWYNKWLLSFLWALQGRRGSVFFKTVLLTIMGFIFSRDLGDPLYMARFGSVIVIYGMYLAYSDYSRYLKDFNKLLERAINGTGRRVVISNHKEVIEYHKRLDFSVICYGTIVWGWGDIPMNYLMNVLAA